LDDLQEGILAVSKDFNDDDVQDETGKMVKRG
jgi:hypothetical protein